LEIIWYDMVDIGHKLHNYTLFNLRRQNKKNQPILGWF
jgi:hypothetical protein